MKSDTLYVTLYQGRNGKTFTLNIFFIIALENISRSIWKNLKKMSATDVFFNFEHFMCLETQGDICLQYKKVEFKSWIDRIHEILSFQITSNEDILVTRE
jgi:hypothetical protein